MNLVIIEEIKRLWAICNVNGIMINDKDGDEEPELD